MEDAKNMCSQGTAKRRNEQRKFYVKTLISLTGMNVQNLALTNLTNSPDRSTIK